MRKNKYKVEWEKYCFSSSACVCICELQSAHEAREIKENENDNLHNRKFPSYSLYCLVIFMKDVSHIHVIREWRMGKRCNCGMPSDSWWRKMSVHMYMEMTNETMWRKFSICDLFIQEIIFVLSFFEFVYYFQKRPREYQSASYVCI